MSGLEDGARDAVLRDYLDRMERVAEGDPVLQRRVAAARTAAGLSVVPTNAELADRAKASDAHTVVRDWLDRHAGRPPVPFETRDEWLNWAASNFLTDPEIRQHLSVVADTTAGEADDRLPADPRSGVHTSCDKFIGVEKGPHGTYLTIWEPARTVQPARSLWANLSPRAIDELVARLLAARSGGAQDDGLRAALDAALDDTATGLWMGEHGPGWGQAIADALLPVVLRYGREKAAEELRAAAEEITGDGRGGFEAALRSIYCTRLLRDRAAALDGDPT